jgi:hypothetical protein
MKKACNSSELNSFSASHNFIFFFIKDLKENSQVVIVAAAAVDGILKSIKKAFVVVIWHTHSHRNQ